MVRRTATAPAARSAVPKASPVAPPTVDEEATTGADVVTVACNLPAGLRLRFFDMVKVPTPVIGGGTRDVLEARLRPDIEDIFIRGTALRAGQPDPYRIVGGYALTPNIPRELWEEWLEQNKDLDAVKRGCILAYKSIAAADAGSRERSEMRSGLEPLNMGMTIHGDRKIVNDTRVRGVGQSGLTVMTADTK